MRYRGLNLTVIWLLIAVNFLFFIATSVNQDLISFLGLQPTSFLDRPWTIVTNLFVHADIWHILGNMLILYFFGSFLYRLIGTRKFLITYFVGGILGNIFYILILPSSLPAIGASGAIYALAGALVVMMPNLKVLLYFIVPMPLWVVVLVFFVLWSFIPGVAWQAHLGGLAFGLIAGYYFRKRARYLL
jgi:membrane associated rhomboid family serine protease